MAVRTQIHGRMRGLQKHCTTAPPDLARLQVGTYAYLKNFRKGLHHQLERCVREVEEAPDAATARECTARLQWVRKKQEFLDAHPQLAGHSEDSGRRKPQPDRELLQLNGEVPQSVRQGLTREAPVDACTINTLTSDDSIPLSTDHSRSELLQRSRQW